MGYKLVLKTGIEGLLVTIHNPTDLSYIKNKVTDENGVAAFNVPNKTVTVSITYTPYTVFNKYMEYGDWAYFILNSGGMFPIQQYIDNGTITRDDLINMIKHGKIRIGIIKDYIHSYGDKDITDQDVDEADTNHDGYLSINEIHQLDITTLDGKHGGIKDGKLESIEMRERPVVFSVIFKNIPVGTYSLKDLDKQITGELRWSGGPSIAPKEYDYVDLDINSYFLPKAHFLITNTPDNDTDDIYIETSGQLFNPITGDIDYSCGKWACPSSYNYKINKNSISVTVKYMPQNNGKFSALIFSRKNKKFLFLKDLASNNITISYNDIVDNGTSFDNISITPDPNVSKSLIYAYQIYNGKELLLGTNAGYGSYMTLNCITHLFSGGETDEQRQQNMYIARANVNSIAFLKYKLYKWLSSGLFVLGGRYYYNNSISIPNSIDVSELPVPDIEVNSVSIGGSNPVDITLGGTDLNKIHSYYWHIRAISQDNNTYNDYGWKEKYDIFLVEKGSPTDSNGSFTIQNLDNIFNSDNVTKSIDEVDEQDPKYIFDFLLNAPSNNHYEWAEYWYQNY